MSKSFAASVRNMDWRIAMGIVVTVLWFVAGIIYLRGNSIQNLTIYEIPLENIGSFLEGAFAPLAFLWLVIGMFLQQKELSNNTEVLRRTSIQSEKQTEAIAATELNARQGTFFKIASSVNGQLGGIGGMLFISSMGASEGQLVPAEKIARMWRDLATGDDQVFAREFLNIDVEKYGGFEHLFYGTDIRTRHTLNFCCTFERLLVMAKSCDSEGIITDAMAQTAHGFLYDRMKAAHPGGKTRDGQPVDPTTYETLIADMKE